MYEQNSSADPTQPARQCLQAGAQAVTGSFPAAQGGKPRLLRVKTESEVALKRGFRQCRYKAPPCHPALTQVQGPEPGRGAPPNLPESRPRRRLPLDLHPRKVVPAAQASSAAPSNPCALERSVRKAQGPPRRLRPQPLGPCLPSTHASTPELGGFLPVCPTRAGSRGRGPQRRAHVPPPPGPQLRSLTEIASSSSHARPTRAIPAAAAYGGLRSPLRLPLPQLRRVQQPRPLPSRSPPPSSRCHVCQSMRTRVGEAAGKRCLLGVVVCSKAGLGASSVDLALSAQRGLSGVRNRKVSL